LHSGQTAKTGRGPRQTARVLRIRGGQEVLLALFATALSVAVPLWLWTNLRAGRPLLAPHALPLWLGLLDAGCLGLYRELLLRAARIRQLEAQAETAQRNFLERAAELETAQDRYRAVLEATSSVPWELDPAAGVFTYIAPQAERVLGWPVECFAEPGFHLACIHPDDRARLQAAVKQMSDGQHRTLEYRLRRSDKSYATIRTELRQAVTTEGRLLLRGTSSDITKQHALEVELRQAQKLESVGRLASGVAHELNTPVQYISDSVHFIQDSLADLARLLEGYRQFEQAAASGAQPPAQLQAMALALAQTRRDSDLDYLLENLPGAAGRSLEGLARVASIVRSLKEFAHADQKSMVAVDLNRAVENTLIIAMHEYKHVATVEKELSSLPPVRCYPGEINQALLAILVNAAHAIESTVRGTALKGLIRVETHREGDQVAISVTDSGGGIADSIRDRIFDPFFTTKEVGKGQGQGLAIARAVVQELHGGRLSFRTEVGRGSTFTIRIPIEGRMVAPAQPSEGASA